MKILLYANGSSENHGCEAIKLSTIKILGNDHQYFIGTTNNDYEKKSKNIEYINYTFQKKYALYERIGKRLGILKKVNGKYLLDCFSSYFAQTDISLSVGGDNYCYEDAGWLYYLHNMAISNNRPSILWGCSLEENLIDGDMKKDLSRFEKIIVRESISFKTLEELGFTNVKLIPDPAFVLDTQKPEISKIKESDRYVGINLSPLVERKEQIEGIVKRNAFNLINYILINTKYNILLIPHVVTPTNNDIEILKEIKKMFLNNGRVILIKDQNCLELKYYISKCDLFFAARTHASIAAYSTKVPTVVIGYSVKSRGIAKDIFGTEDNYVIPIDTIVNNDTLKNSFLWLMKNKNKIQERLDNIMPQYIESTYELQKIVDEIMDREK